MFPEGKERKLLMTAQLRDRILIIGESHVSGYAERLSETLFQSYRLYLWEHPHGSTSPSPVTPHIQQSFFLTTLSFSLSTSGHCSLHSQISNRFQ